MLFVFLAPHQNVRYKSSLEKLSLAELRIMLDSYGIDAALERCTIAGQTALYFEAGEREREAMDLCAGLSSLYMVCSGSANGPLYPVRGRRPADIGEDISGILKYKGKTNEMFTRALINVARYSGAFASSAERLALLDPVCGRGTTLLEGLNAGYEPWGIDINKKDAAEFETFIKSYFTHNRLKHSIEAGSLTCDGKPCRELRIAVAPTQAEWRDGEKRALRYITGDTLLADKLLPKRLFPLIAGDLPYGVQHAPGGGARSLVQFAEKAIPVWARLLAPGGAMALSFNTYTLKRSALLDIMRGCGLGVCEGGAYDSMEHWVEQAVNRDVVVAVRR